MEQLRLTGYVEARLVVDGDTLDDEVFYYDDGKRLDSWLKDWKMRAMSTLGHTQIFLLNHNHDPIDDYQECACGDELKDQEPFWEWPPSKRGPRGHRA